MGHSGSVAPPSPVSDIPECPSGPLPTPPSRLLLTAPIEADGLRSSGRAHGAGARAYCGLSTPPGAERLLIHSGHPGRLSVIEKLSLYSNL